MGLVFLVTFHGKVLLQKLWIFNVSWDDLLPIKLFKEWKKVSQSLTEISSLKISQFVGGNINKGNNQLLIFCDASTKAYATVLYLRLEKGQTNLLFSKMCLVPKKKKQCFTLGKGEKPLAMFIENRVREILMEKYISFRYIVFEQNPADIATRGSVVSEIKQSTVW